MLEDIIFILLIALMLCIPLSIAFTINNDDYKSHKDRIKINYATKVTFETFMEWYNLNPKAWYFADNAVYRYGEDAETRYDIVFSSRDSWKKYKKWLAKRSEDKKKTEKEQKREELLNLIKKDMANKNN